MKKNILTGHQQSALDIKNNIALTANAGSGKTFVLSKRFLEIALKGNIPLRKIAAITFTEKAASELYRKISSDVEKSIEASDDPALTEKLNRIRRNLVSANISTIHSFCINILREYPVEAELDANFIPVDPSISGELLELSVDDVIKGEIAAGGESVKSLIRLFSSRKKLSEEIYQLVLNRKNVLDYRELYSKDVNEIAEYFYCSYKKFAEQYLEKKLPRYIKAVQRIIDDVFLADNYNKIAVGAVSNFNKLKNAKIIEEILNILPALDKSICTQKHTVQKNLVKKIQPDHEDISIIEELSSEIAFFNTPENHKDIEIQLALFGKDIVEIFEKVLDRYEEKKRTKGYLDFEDILLHTKRLLEDVNIRRSVSENFEYIMVDEYQDTNEIQYDIFLPILNYLKRGNLFVVGDEKQSIYMFRDAELEVFNKTKNDIVNSSNGRILMLPDSFRMGPEICLFTNYIFRRLFSEPELIFNEVPHSDLVCARQNPSDAAEIGFLLEDEEKNISEAELIAGKILQLKEEGKINWSSAAVLSRKRRSFDELEEVFVKHKIPYLIMGGRNFYQRQSVYDIYNYFSFLLDNNNDAALAGILRSPFFNLSDAKLYEISLNKGFNFYQKLLSSTDESLSEVKIKITGTISLAGYLDAPALLRKMLKDSGYIGYLSSRENGVQEIANLRKLINVTIKYYSQGFKTLYDYVSFLKTNIEETEDEAQALIADESNTVKIMTIHQAKGLEFPVVFLFKCAETAQQTKVIQKTVVVDKNFGILTKVPLNLDYYEDYFSAPIINISNFISAKKNNAELRRLLYVAVTRARDSLYFTAYKSENYNSDSFMGLLTRVINLSGNDIKIKDNLKFLKNDNNTYTESENEMEITISISDSVEFTSGVDNAVTVETKNIYIIDLEDSQKDEIISATRYSVYTHCPLKYKLRYIDGIREVNEHITNINEIEEKDSDILSGSAGIKGRVIHKVLQEWGKIPSTEIIKNMILREDPLYKQVDALTTGIISDLKGFFSSDISTYLNKMPGEKHNEYEVYFRDNDYILYGIIDKLVIDNETITIIDYKTDDIDKDKISERAAEYLNQLKFYSYIIWNTFNRSFRISFNIIFIKHPEEYYKKEETVEELLKTGVKIQEMISGIRQNKFMPDRSYCRRCVYSKDHVNCIKKLD